MVRGRKGGEVECGWGLCVSGRTKKKSRPQPRSGQTRGGRRGDARRRHLTLGAETPVFPPFTFL